MAKEFEEKVIFKCPVATSRATFVFKKDIGKYEISCIVCSAGKYLPGCKYRYCGRYREVEKKEIL